MSWLFWTIAAISLPSAARGATVTYNLEVRQTTVDFLRPTINLAPPANRANISDIPTALQRTAFLINDAYPAPLLTMNVGDTLVLRLTNSLSESTSLHLHGFHMVGMPWHDGSAGVTQCSIASGATYTYQYTANIPGTFWYHSHSALQYEWGIAGPVVVQDPADPRTSLYSEDRIVAFNDWYFNPTTASAGSYPSVWADPARFRMLINGQWGNGSAEYPYPQIDITAGNCYRFRFINMGSEIDSGNIAISVANHNMTLIALDGGDINPVTVSTIGLNVGERADAILCANQPEADYQLTVSSSLLQGGSPSFSVIATIHYLSNPSAVLPATPDPIVSLTVSTQNVSLLHAVPRLAPVGPASLSLTPTVLNMGAAYYLSPTNTVPFVAPDEPPLFSRGQCGLNALSQMLSFDGSTNFNRTVDFIVNNVHGKPHPLHLHGHSFWLLGLGGETEGVFNITKHGARLNMISPVMKDTISIPRSSWAVFRFVLNNPGLWLMHCHINKHHMTGMAILINELGSYQTRPPSDLPRCAVSCTEASYWPTYSRTMTHQTRTRTRTVTGQTRTRTRTRTISPQTRTRTMTKLTRTRTKTKRTRTRTLTHETHTRTKTKQTRTRTITHQTRTRTKTRETRTRTITKKTRTRTKTRQTRTRTMTKQTQTATPTATPKSDGASSSSQTAIIAGVAVGAGLFLGGAAFAFYRFRSSGYIRTNTPQELRGF